MTGRKIPSEEKSLMKQMKAHVGIMEAKMRRWGFKIKKFAASTDANEPGENTDYRKNLDTLISKHRVVRAKLDELKASGFERWRDLKDGVDNAWNDFELTLENLTK